MTEHSFADGPLTGLKVVDCATVLAGPGCARYLGDFGADVIKVERPGGGDTTRAMGWRHPDDDLSLWWKYVGRNKRSVVLDLKDPDDLALVRRLLAEADVLVENFRPGTLERLGLAPDDLLAANPRLVITRVTGFGQDGPYAQRPGFATIAEAMSGFAGVNGEPDGGPLLPPIALTDEITAVVAAFATLAAVHSGVGQVVDVNLYESLLQMMGPLPAAKALFDYDQPRMGSSLPYSVPRGTYQARDGRWIAISASAEPVAQRVMALIGLGDDPRTASFAARVEHRELVEGTLAAWVAARTPTTCSSPSTPPMPRPPPSTPWATSWPTPTWPPATPCPSSTAWSCRASSLACRPPPVGCAGVVAPSAPTPTPSAPSLPRPPTTGRSSGPASSVLGTDVARSGRDRYQEVREASGGRAHLGAQGLDDAGEEILGRTVLVGQADGQAQVGDAGGDEGGGGRPGRIEVGPVVPSAHRQATDDAEATGVATGGLDRSAHLGDAGERVGGGRAPGDPPGPEARQPAGRATVDRAADPHRHAPRLEGLGHLVDGLEAQLGGVVAGLGLPPQRLAHLQGVVEQAAPVLEGQPAGLVLLALPPDPHAEVEPAPGEHVEGGGRLGQHRRPAQGGQQDVGGQPDAGGRTRPGRSAW